MVINRPDDTVITRHPLAIALVRSGAVDTTTALADGCELSARIPGRSWIRKVPVR
jgi:hypothetical protein